jgi:lysozyme
MGSSVPAPKPAPAPVAEGGVYVVKSGDTLSAIAQRFGTTYQYLAQINGIANPNLIFPGQKIKVQAQALPQNERYYRVVRGDTLSAIAARYGTTYQKIAADNGIANPNLIYTGQVLVIK